MDEAIFLADRILALKPHPGEVLELIEVPVPRPRPDNVTNTEEFLATRRRLEELIHEKDEADHLPGDDDSEAFAALPRLTDVTDSVE